MFRMETEVDQDRQKLLGERLEQNNAQRSPAIRVLRGTPHEDEVPLEVWAFDDATGELAGGLTGFTWARWLHVDLLWVADPHRSTGGWANTHLRTGALRPGRGLPGRCVGSRSPPT